MGLRKFTATGSAYYPKRSKMEGGFLDRMGVKLNTLQDYFNNTAEYVSVAMDKNLGLRYGIVVKIPEIEDDYQQVIEFRVVDTGDAFTGKGFTRIDICVADKEAAKDETINGKLTLIFKE